MLFWKSFKFIYSESFTIILAYAIGNTVAKTWKGVRFPAKYRSLDKSSMYLLPTFFSSLGQQHFSVIMALIQQEILIAFANFIANQCKQIHVCV